MVRITAIHLVGGTRHEHIQSVRWTNPNDSTTGESTRSEMVDWIDHRNGSAYVQDSLGNIPVHTVHPANGSAYIQTYADNRPTDNLLYLPKY